MTRPGTHVRIAREPRRLGADRGASAGRPSGAARGLVRRALGPLAALVLLAAPAAACPYCALSQGTETLVYILCFLGIPYVIFSGTWLWMRRVLREERAELNAAGGSLGGGSPTEGSPRGDDRAA